MPHIRCTVPGCKKSGPAESMWLPERKARAAANGDRRVELADFPKFAHCGYHGHLLRQTGVRMYRYSEEVKLEEACLERQRAREAEFQAHAQRFYMKQGEWAKTRHRDGQPRVGGGLSRFVHGKGKTSSAPTKPEPAPAMA